MCEHTRLTEQDRASSRNYPILRACWCLAWAGVALVVVWTLLVLAFSPALNRVVGVLQ